MWLINNYLKKKKWLLYALGLVGLVAVSTFFISLIIVAVTATGDWQAAFGGVLVSILVLLLVATSISCGVHHCCCANAEGRARRKI